VVARHILIDILHISVVPSQQVLVIPPLFDISSPTVGLGLKVDKGVKSDGGEVGLGVKVESVGGIEQARL
jgi:hypothetical protein